MRVKSIIALTAVIATLSIEALAAPRCADIFWTIEDHRAALTQDRLAVL